MKSNYKATNNMPPNTTTPLPNPILLKDQQGKVKQPVYHLPNQKHTYGKKILDDPQPIKYVVNGWKQAQSRATIIQKIDKYDGINQKGQKVMPIMLPEQDFTYGVSNRPSTPVKLVIGNCYGLQKQRQNQQKYMRQTQLKQAQKNKKLQAAKTKSQLLRQQTTNKQFQYRQKPNIQQKFKLSKFTSDNISKKINTGIEAFSGNTNTMNKSNA